MAKPEFTARDFRDAAVRAAADLGRLTEFKATNQDGLEVWTLKAEIDPERLRRRDDPAAVVEPVAPSAPPPAVPMTGEPNVTVPERLIDKKTLARQLDVGLRTLEGMISAGRVPAPIKPAGRLLKWRAAEIDDWMRAGCPERASWQTMTQGTNQGERRRQPKGR